MKKLTTILLLLICLQYTFGLYVVYVFNRLEIKQQMRQAINTGLFQPHEVVTLVMSTQHFNDAKKGYWQHDEINYKGKMYDIISTQQQANGIIVKCLRDDDENNLVASFLHIMQKARQFPGKRINVLSHAFSPFILSDISYSLRCSSISEAPFLPMQIAHISTRFRHVPTPPPWQFS